MSKKVEDDKKVERKQSSATIMISVDGKGTAFSSEVKIINGIVWIRILRKRFLKKI